VTFIRLHHLPTGQAIDLDPAPRKALLAVYLANQVVKYRHVYCPNMEIDEVPDAVTTELALPNWITLLQDTRLTALIDRTLQLSAANGATPARAA
jgi:hypothetical protein